MSYSAEFTPPANPYKRQHPPSCQELLDHSSLFTPETVYNVGINNDVFVYVGWNLANITIVSAPDGLVIVDSGQDTPQMANVWAEFTGPNSKAPAEMRSKKVAAVFLTHHHTDHCCGTQWLIDNNLFVDNSNPLIYGADNLNAEFQQENGLIAPLMGCRAMAQYNNLLKHSGHPEDTRGMNSGIGPIISSTLSGYVRPNQLISTANPYQIQKITIAGREFQVVYVPSEANSEIAAYLADSQVLLSAEVIQDHTFPNLYSLRGGSFRDPSNWYKSIDCFLDNFSDAQYLVLQHGPPILKNDIDPNNVVTTQPIKEVLTRYRDAIQYVRDQTLRWALKGYAKEEIIHLVHLPKDQENYSPWLRQFYGTVKHSIPAVYNGYIGWFDGDPVSLNPLPRSVISKRMVTLMGGRENLLVIASAAYEKGNKLAEDGEPIENALQEWQYAAELATLLIRERPYDKLTQNPEALANNPNPPHLLHPTAADGDAIWWYARYLKGACFRQIGFRNICANWRGTYLTAGYELEGKNLVGRITGGMRLAELAMAKKYNVEMSLSELQVRVRPEKAADGALVFLVEIKEDNSTAIYRLRIRNGILAVTDFTGTINDTDVKITGTTEALNLLVCGDVPAGDNDNGYDAVLTNPNRVVVTPADGGLDKAKKFFGSFDGGRLSSSPNIYVH